MSLYNSTRIYVLEKGQIVSEGTFEYLSNNSPEFASQLGAMRGYLKQ
jgi:ABC-type multidrug transport system fused ATPase/permease subunit